jgi:hypothetical protein
MEVFSMSFRAETIYAGLLPGLVERLSSEKGLGSLEAMRLSLATEELVAYVASAIKGQPMTLGLHTMPYGVQLNLSFHLESKALKYFNFVVDHEEILGEEGDINHLGLVIAANAVDSYKIAMKSGQIEIQLLKEKEFTTIESKAYTPTLKPISKEEPLAINQDRLEEVSGYVQSTYATSYYEDRMVKSAKVFAYIQADELQYTAVYDMADKVVGFMYWDKRDESCYEFFGPYVFLENKKEISEILSSQMVEKCARSGAYFLYSEKSSPDLPTQFFEELMLSEIDHGKFYYRQLKEDMGGSIWCHSALRAYVDDIYDQLLLFRDVSDAESAGGENQNKHSVFSVEPDHTQSMAIIVPYIYGEDAEQNISRHLNQLQQEGYKDIRVKLDLHFKWQAYLAKLFFDQGFKPLFIKPKAGVSDILIMRYYGA